MATGTYQIRGNELWIEITPELLQRIINDPRIRVVLEGRLWFVIRLSGPAEAVKAKDMVNVMLGGGS